MSQRHRREYAADLPHSLPDRQVQTFRKFTPRLVSGGCAPRPALIHQI
jgi:hypothetical protein